ncbi:MAG: hypothetical protein M1273_03175 [Deltaproteobacteria bacterium]|jgi:DNA-binding CsgD family transcriptional regulator|nr:hypothetical protein [Deltaproteobacteria bacterium]
MKAKRTGEGNVKTKHVSNAAARDEVSHDLKRRKKLDKPAQTQKERVFELVRSGKADTVSEISGILNLSKMSVYRYVRALAHEGKISKTFNKLYPYSEAEIAGEKSPVTGKCEICSKQITDERLKVVINFKDGRKLQFCCAHCAIIAAVHSVDDLNSISSIMGMDFIYGNPLDIRNGFLLFKTDVIPCCSPPILVFARQSNAERFQAGFGGDIISFDDIISHMKF